MKGYSDVLVGVQYGDEGKARVIDNIAHEYDVIARFNGGPNAGHTIEVGNTRIALHQVPSGVFHENMLLYVGSGCVLNLEKLLNEIQEITEKGFSVDGRLFLSDQASVIQPHHILLDQIMGKAIGTTANGIGPVYADQALRTDGINLRNLRLGDVLDDPHLARAAIIGNYTNALSAHNLRSEESSEKAERIIDAANLLRKAVCRNPLFLDSLVREGKKVLFEGAQSSSLDVSKGTVPYVTSSHTIAGSAYVGGDLAPRYHRKTMGVAKAVMSRVGNGPFVSEFGGKDSEDYCAAEGGKRFTKEVEFSQYSVKELLQSGDMFKTGIALRMLGNEYGATTKRPRRIGMLDLVSLNQNCRINGVDELYINKMDCLTDFAGTPLEGIPLVKAYILGGQEITYVPGTSKANRDAQPVVEYQPHIRSDISGAREYLQLTREAQELIKQIEQYVGCKVAGIGVGPDREQFMMLSE